MSANLTRIVGGMGLAVLVATGCNLFETRVPEEPTQASSNFVPPTEPSIVFTNMVSSFRDLNAVNYIRSFADTATAGRNFTFEPTPPARLRYGPVFQLWTRQSEQQYFENVRARLQPGSSVSLEFTALTPQSIQADSAQYEAVYRLSVPHIQPGLPREAQGRALFFMMADRSRNWVVWRWVDIAHAPNDFTWSDLKGEFGQ